MTSSAQGKLGLSKWAFLGGLLTTEEELAGQPEYEAWKAETGKTGPDVFYAEKTAEHASAKYAQGIAYSVYRPGDELTPFIHVGDFADEKSALKALVTESGEAYAWNQEGKTLATRYESMYDAENSVENSTGTIRVLERGIAPYRRPVMDQARLEQALVEAEGQVTQAGSLITAKRFLNKMTDGQPHQLYRPNDEQSSKTGPIVWSDTNIAIQDIGNNGFIAHDAEKIKQAVIAASLVAQDVRQGIRISYNNGQVTAESLQVLQKGNSALQGKSEIAAEDNSPWRHHISDKDNDWLNEELKGEDHNHDDEPESDR